MMMTTRPDITSALRARAVARVGKPEAGTAHAQIETQAHLTCLSDLPTKSQQKPDRRRRRQAAAGVRVTPARSIDESDLSCRNYQQTAKRSGLVSLPR